MFLGQGLKGDASPACPYCISKCEISLPCNVPLAVEGRSQDGEDHHLHGVRHVREPHHDRQVNLRWARIMHIDFIFAVKLLEKQSMNYVADEDCVNNT